MRPQLFWYPNTGVEKKKLFCKIFLRAPCDHDSIHVPCSSRSRFFCNFFIHNSQNQIVITYHLYFYALSIAITLRKVCFHHRLFKRVGGGECCNYFVLCNLYIYSIVRSYYCKWHTERTLRCIAVGFRSDLVFKLHKNDNIWE